MAGKLSSNQLSEAIKLQSQLWTHERIASVLGVHRTSVSRALSKINRRALDRITKRVASLKAAQIAQLEFIADEALQEWQRSKLDAESIKTTTEGPEAEGDESGPVILETKVEKAVKGQCGDTSYLSEARAALTDVRKILGIDKSKLELSGEDGGPITHTIDFTRLSVSELDDLGRIAERLADAGPAGGSEGG